MIIVLNGKKYNFNGYVEPINSIKEMSEAGYKQGRADASTELVNEFKNIDFNEFAMFSLSLIEEIAEQLKGGRQWQAISN